MKYLQILAVFSFFMLALGTDPTTSHMRADTLNHQHTPLKGKFKIEEVRFFSKISFQGEPIVHSKCCQYLKMAPKESKGQPWLHSKHPETYDPCQVRAGRVASFFSYKKGHSHPGLPFARIMEDSCSRGQVSQALRVQHATYKGTTPVARWLTSNGLWDKVTSRVICTWRVGMGPHTPSLCGQSPDHCRRNASPLIVLCSRGTHQSLQFKVHGR